MIKGPQECTTVKIRRGEKRWSNLITVVDIIRVKGCATFFDIEGPKALKAEYEGQNIKGNLLKETLPRISKDSNLKEGAFMTRLVDACIPESEKELVGLTENKKRKEIRNQ